MAEHSQQYPVSTMCRVLGVSVSGYYDWREREPSAHEREDGQLAKEIHRIFYAHRGVYGSPRVHAELRAEGIGCSKERTARLMHEMELCATPNAPNQWARTNAMVRLRLPTSSTGISLLPRPTPNG
jgi:transposase InsO family protein